MIFLAWLANLKLRKIVLSVLKRARYDRVWRAAGPFLAARTTSTALGKARAEPLLLGYRMLRQRPRSGRCETHRSPDSGLAFVVRHAVQNSPTQRQIDGAESSPKRARPWLSVQPPRDWVTTWRG